MCVMVRVCDLDGSARDCLYGDMVDGVPFLCDGTMERYGEPPVTPQKTRKKRREELATVEEPVVRTPAKLLGGGLLTKRRKR